ncbi:hypothetical protein HZU75_09585 [Chitinibacter fontanus]|uniref:Uncharacterized protein n=1 Tax=Chitinibacter fontanus TaxID=1737446 RepID=A0A7D5ZES5_9NEIS|nr:hypothetical protein [Chitinibacter fontanus]QLI81764.1 hypothetical protein HZU75_09585 [Chitinibacter fontanus]
MIKNQFGSTLVSLMVGVAISLIVVVGMMSMYKNTVKISAHASQDAMLNSRRTASFLTAGINLQSAGFGIETPNSSDEIKVITTAALSADNKLTGTLSTTTTRTGNAIVWRSLDTGVSKCSGLLSPAEGGLLLLNAADCANASEWNTLTWTTTQIMSAAHSKTTADVTSTEIDDAVLITVKTQNCTPLGISAVNGNVLVELKVKNSNNLDSSQSTCLANFVAP